MAQPDIASIEGDYKLADHYLETFKEDTRSELDAHGKMLQNAIDTVQEFKNLKEEEKSNDWSALFDGVFTALSAGIPAVGLTAFLAKQAVKADIAFKAARIFKTRLPAAAVAVKGTIAAGKAANIANDVKEKWEKVAGAVKAVEEMVASQEESPADKLSAELDARRRAIKDLINANHQRVDVWKKAWAALFLKYTLRMHGLDLNPRETLLDFVKQLVELPPRLSDSELDQLASRYQWEMIAAWARLNVTIVEIYRVGPNFHESARRKSVLIEGLNDPQIAMLFQLFGVHVPRGKMFTYPPVYLTVAELAYRWGCPKVHQEHKFGPRRAS